MLVVLLLMLSFAQVFKPASALVQELFCASIPSSQADKAGPAALQACAACAAVCQI
jgi:hypothetical protein